MTLRELSKLYERLVAAESRAKGIDDILKAKNETIAELKGHIVAQEVYIKQYQQMLMKNGEK